MRSTSQIVSGIYHDELIGVQNYKNMVIGLARPKWRSSVRQGHFTNLTIRVEVRHRGFVVYWIYFIFHLLKVSI